jgi:hypothetical protein
LLHWLTNGAHWEVLAAILAVLTIGWRAVVRARRAAKAALGRLTASLDDRITMTAAQIAEPIVEAQTRTQRAVLAHTEECRQDRASTHWRITGLEREVAYIRGQSASSDTPTQIEARVHIEPVAEEHARG